jgi:2-polyprenyl-6-methoxyphenol hydroxylase-like FAD-dependent oxidoreductase
MSKRFEVAIVGGGVAGSALATVLARAGRSVLVIERERTFRDRVRGESIHPWGLAEVVRLGLESVLDDAGARRLPAWRRYIERVPKPDFLWSEIAAPGLAEVSVSHVRLQNALLAAAESAGATLLRPAKAHSLGPNNELEIETSSGIARISAELVVGADGRNSAVRKWLGSTVHRDLEHHRIGGALFRGVGLDSDASHEIRFGGGRSFTFPQGDGLARSYVVTNTRRNRDVQDDHTGRAAIEFLAATYPERAFARAELAGPIAFFSNADIWTDEIARDSAVLIGDAAGANDPSLGQGLSLAFRDVRELSDLLRSETDPARALAEFARRRRDYYQVLRRHASWEGILVTEMGEEADARRERVERARETDPTAGGFTLIFVNGPDGLVPNEASRARYFGEAS